MLKANSHRVYLLICSVALFLYIVTSSIINTDVWFLLANGDYIRQNWLPTNDWQSVYGYPVVIYQVGTDLVFSYLNEWFGVDSLPVLCGIVWTITLILVCSFAKKEYFVSYSLATFAVAMAISTNTTLRPQMFSILLTIILIRVLYGENEKVKGVVCAIVLPLQVFFHATFWVLVVAICVWYCICKKPSKEVVCGILAGIAISAFYSYCLTPYGSKILFHPLYCIGVSAYSQIDELQNMNFVWTIVAVLFLLGALFTFYKTKIQSVKDIKRQDLFVPVMAIVALIGTTVATRLSLFAYCLIGIMWVIALRDVDIKIKFFNRCAGAIMMCVILLVFSTVTSVQKTAYKQMYERADMVGEYLVEQGATSVLSNLDTASPYLFYRYGLQQYFDTRLETYIPSFNETEDIFTPYINWVTYEDDSFVRDKNPEWIACFSDREDTPVPDNYILKTTLIQDNSDISQEYQSYLKDTYDIDFGAERTIKIYQRQE